MIATQEDRRFESLSLQRGVGNQPAAFGVAPALASALKRAWCNLASASVIASAA